jgi:hypothetical protein
MSHVRRAVWVVRKALWLQRYGDAPRPFWWRVRASWRKASELERWLAAEEQRWRRTT